MAETQFKNCAIYTRVSTDMQAEKEFSSCEAQEQKIRYFIESQNGFRVFKVYSDGGYSSANTNRPALQGLLSDIRQKKIDVILAYKIDRLTRSPKDFYQLIEIFDKYGVSFISITERFDTSTPSGRLLRNIMLTFAQFERELTSERTRDKMAERAKKGLYNGGYSPLGYDRKNKKLFINKKEAEQVRMIFEKYIETESLTKIYDYLKQNNIKNKYGTAYYKSAIAYLLRNVLYIGKINHKGKIYQGIHEPIISEEIFNLVQQIHNGKPRRFKIFKNHIFGGLIKCGDCGSIMTPTFSNKRNNGKLRRYHYYRCTSTVQKDWNSCSIRQVSAERLENYILEGLERISKDKSYVENLVFRLNNDRNSGPCLGFELTGTGLEITAENIIFTLRSFLSGIAKRKEFEKNLYTKRFFKSISYSKEEIKLSLFCLQNNGRYVLPAEMPSRRLAARSAARVENEKTGFNPLPAELLVRSEQNCCGTWIRTMINGFRVRRPTVRRSRINKLRWSKAPGYSGG